MKCRHTWESPFVLRRAGLYRRILGEFGGERYVEARLIVRLPLCRIRRWVSRDGREGSKAAQTRPLRALGPARCWLSPLRQAASHRETPRSAVRLASIARRARTQPKWAQPAQLARRCSTAAPVEKVVSHSRGPRGVARFLQRALGWRGRPQRPLRARRASGLHPSGRACRVSPHQALSGVMYPSGSPTAQG
jgi:hypothetical protein